MRRLPSLGALVVVSFVLGCESQEPTPIPSPRRTASAIPVDTTLPGELAEGEHVAFGFPGPRRMRVEAQFDDAVYFEGPVPLEAATNYVRARVKGGKTETGPTRTVFDNVQLADAPDRRVRVEVTLRHGMVEMVVRNRTPRPIVEPSLPEAERWRRAGLHADGTVIENQAE